MNAPLVKEKSIPVATRLLVRRLTEDSERVLKCQTPSHNCLKTKALAFSRNGALLVSADERFRTVPLPPDKDLERYSESMLA